MDPLHDLCLTCLSKPNLPRKLDDILMENLKIMEILQKLIPNFMENQELPLPNCICRECLEKLMSAYTFQKQCLDSMENLHKMWKTSFQEKLVKQEIEEIVFNKIEDDLYDEDHNTLNEENPLKDVTMDSLLEEKQDTAKKILEEAKDSLCDNDKANADDILFKSFEMSEEDDNDIGDDDDFSVSEENKDKQGSENNVYKCEYCEKSFKLAKSLATHKARTHFPESIYKCKICNKKFFMEEVYKIHVNKHQGIKPYKCEQCYKAFVSITLLKQHIICHSNETPFSCKICGKSFNRVSSLRQHLQRHNNERPYKCKLCSKTFKCISDFSKHRSKHAKKRYKCKFCNTLHLTLEILQLHQEQKHSENKVYKCSQCNESFRARSLRRCHEKIHTTERPYKCEHCAREYFEKIECKMHIKHKHKDKYKPDNNEEDEDEYSESSLDEIDEEIKDLPLETLQDNEKVKKQKGTESKEPLKAVVKEMEDKIVSDTDYNESKTKKKKKSNRCEICNKSFKEAHGLNVHLSRIHYSNFKYKCDICNRGYNNEDYYQKHCNRHLDIKTHKCQHCGKAFDTGSTLNQHLISHSKETPYMCFICGRSFNRSGTLRTHMLRHGDAKPYECSECHKNFKCHSDLLRHEKIHGEKRFECELCGKRLSSTTAMAVHKLVHSGEKPHECNFCGRCFNSTSNLKCHIRIHTGEKPYKCPFCGKTFRQSYDRKKHALRMHPAEMAANNGEFVEDKKK